MLLSGELATLISGRYVQFVVYPLSYKEFLLLNAGKSFMGYSRLGDMPFISNIIGDEKAVNLYLEDVYNSVVLKDVVKRNNIRDVDSLDRTITYVLANVSQTFSATSISKYFKSEQRGVSTDTVLNYIRACEEAYLFYGLKRQDIKGKKILRLLRNILSPTTNCGRPSMENTWKTLGWYWKTSFVWSFCGADTR